MERFSRKTSQNPLRLGSARCRGAVPGGSGPPRRPPRHAVKQRPRGKRSSRSCGAPGGRSPRRFRLVFAAFRGVLGEVFGAERGFLAPEGLRARAGRGLGLGAQALEPRELVAGPARGLSACRAAREQYFGMCLACFCTCSMHFDASEAKELDPGGLESRLGPA